MKFYEAVPELLRRAEVGHVFALLGAMNVVFAAEGVRRGDFELVNMRHEEAAVAGATAYARSTGRLGVATVTRGPGFANAINAMIGAEKSHVPVMLIVGESPTSTGRDEYSFSEQQIPQRELSEVIGAGFHHVARPEELEDAFWSAVTEAWRFGTPQVLSLSNKLNDTEVTLSDVVPARPAEPEVDMDAVRAVVDLLERTERPVILAGQGAVLSQAHAPLVELAELIGARLTTSLRAHRFFAGHPHDLGLSGTWAAPAVRDVLAETDVLLAFGASMNPKTTYGDAMFGSARIVHCEIDVDSEVRASSPELALLGSARSVAEALVAEWRSRGHEPRPVVGTPSPTREERVASILKADLDHDPTRGLDVRRVAVAIDALLPEDRVVLTDSGRTVSTTAGLVEGRDARSWLTGRSYGSIGLGVATAIGAAFGHPDRPVVLLAGDAGFMMGISGLDTIRYYGLDVTIVILNDEQLGSERRYLGKFGLPMDVITHELPDIPALAAAFGGHGTVVRTEEDLANLELPLKGLHLIDARLDPSVDGNAAYA